MQCSGVPLERTLSRVSRVLHRTTHGKLVKCSVARESKQLCLSCTHMRGETIQRLVVSKSKHRAVGRGRGRGANYVETCCVQVLKFNAFVIPSLLCVSVGFIRPRLTLKISIVSGSMQLFGGWREWCACESQCKCIYMFKKGLEICIKNNCRDTMFFVLLPGIEGPDAPSGSPAI